MKQEKGLSRGKMTSDREEKESDDQRARGRNAEVMREALESTFGAAPGPYSFASYGTQEP